MFIILAYCKCHNFKDVNLYWFIGIVCTGTVAVWGHCRARGDPAPTPAVPADIPLLQSQYWDQSVGLTAVPLVPFLGFSEAASAGCCTLGVLDQTCVDAYRLVFTYFWQICIYYCTFNVSLITDQDKKKYKCFSLFNGRICTTNYRSSIKQINNNIMYRGHHWPFVCYVLKDCSQQHYV